MPEIWFNSPGVRLFAIDKGSGPVIVMLHGGMADHRAVLPIVDPLAARYRILAPDVRGSGRSRCGTPLTFDLLAADLENLLDFIGVDRAIVGGVSSGSGIALRFALSRPDRTAALIVVKPVYAGDEFGYTDAQKSAFASMDDLASQAPEKGIQVLRPLYANLPAAMRDRALAMLEEFDPASVAATSHFLASGAQPFTAAQLTSLSVPTLLIAGDDPLHPRHVSELYAANIAGCTAMSATIADVTGVIDGFVERLLSQDSEP